MRVNGINTLVFQGLYKIDRKYVGDKTEEFIYSNQDNVVISMRHWSDDVYVLTPDSKDTEFEQCVKEDNGKYWKSKPLSHLMMYPNFLDEIFRINKVSNDHKEDWVDYTDNWQPPKEDTEDEIPF